MDFAGPVGGDYHKGLIFCGNRANFRDRDLIIREHFQQESFEFFVAAVHFIDQQHDRLVMRMFNGLEERPAQQIIPAEEV